MSSLPVFFRKQGENIINSYTYVDIIQGRGVLELYAGDISTATGNAYVLSSRAFYSTSGSVALLTGTDTVDIDFDVKLDKPITFDGRALISIPVKITTGAATFYPEVNLYNYDGSTEVFIASGAAVTALASSQIAVVNIALTIPRTTIKAGNYLRLNTKFYGVASGKAGTVYFDAANRTTINGSATAMETTRMDLQMPVVIED
jgi:hypothetical protein